MERLSDNAQAYCDYGKIIIKDKSTKYELNIYDFDNTGGAGNALEFGGNDSNKYY